MKTLVLALESRNYQRILFGNFIVYCLVFASTQFIASCTKGSDNNPTPSQVSPTVATTALSAITQTTASSGGNITSDGGAAITARGVCWNTSASPTIANNKTSDGTGTGAFVSALTGLSPNTTYYLRSYATNSAGTSYGSSMTFTTTGAASTVTDIDGNVYQTVTIGTQIWMAENLRVTKYRNGEAIPNVTDGTSWFNLTTGAYCNYDNVVANATLYGRMYNWYAVHDARNIAPAGWHVSSETEWVTMENYLDNNIAATKLREAGTTHWLSPNTGTNSTGFTALPGGFRGDLGVYANTAPVVGKYIEWWCKNSSGRYYTRITNYSTASNAVDNFNNRDKTYGGYVRCVKD